MKNKYLRTFWYALPTNYKYLVRKLYYLPQDVIDKLTGNTHKYVPPRGSIYTGSPASAKTYISQSKHQLNLLKQEIDLKPSDHVLDIGSGIGRTAISLCEFLDNHGKYEGFDVVKLGVDWCKSRIGKDFPNFNFTYVPLFNDLYNDDGQKAENFKFPYTDNEFDKIFSFSVFTHMQIEEIQNYLFEINRVLKKDGLASSTFFLYNDEEIDAIIKNEKFNFRIEREGYRLMNDKVKSANIAIDKERLNLMAKNANLEIVSILNGFWKGTSNAIEFQDFVVFKKIDNPN